MGQPGAEVIAFMIDEHLGLILEAAERGAVHDPVAIALERAAQARGGLGVAPAAAVVGVAGIVGGLARLAAFRPTGVTRGANAAV
jgi:hypothetical protein